MAHNDNVVHSSGVYNSRYFLVCVVYTACRYPTPSRKACISRYLWVIYTVKNHAIEPASAGIYRWYIPRYTTCSYIICTKLKIFLAFLQEKRLLSQPFFNTIFQNQIQFFQFPYLILILH